jgi:hypothetical protein
VGKKPFEYRDFKVVLCTAVPPAIGDTERIVTVNEGETATLKCDSTGSPPPKISWIQHGRTLIETAERYMVNTDGSLTILDVQVRYIFSLTKISLLTV